MAICSKQKLPRRRTSTYTGLSVQFKKYFSRQRSFNDFPIVHKQQSSAFSYSRWGVIKLLGSGGFGDVYKVAKVNNPDKTEYAMKTEMVVGNRQMLRLKIEVMVLMKCHAQTDPERKGHFVAFVDRGKTDKFKADFALVRRNCELLMVPYSSSTFKKIRGERGHHDGVHSWTVRFSFVDESLFLQFLVMGLVGPSLEDIRRKDLLKNYSKATAMTCCIQTLTALRDLHGIGYIHRDIKPQNYAIGLGEKESTIYMLDFGIARKYTVGDTKVVKVPRVKVHFLGTLRFASRACHRQIEQGCKDDLECWLYMVPLQKFLHISFSSINFT
uniref:Protein kinase domain-containing protein n=1 Tax=Angiostrongylus cantonensis TaxID=6313 RepID=A0A0K0DD07_ANGCA